jgi:hypothetical protein
MGQLRYTKVRTSSSESLIVVYENSSDPRNLRLASRLKKCGSILIELDRTTGEVKQRTYYCAAAACQRCHQRRQRRGLNTAMGSFKELIKLHGLDFLVLSIGFKSTNVENLSIQRQQIRLGLKQLMNRWNRWPGQGCITSIEFSTKDARRVQLNAHLIIAVPESYFAPASYIKQSEWRQEISRVTKIQASVHVQKVRGQTQSEKLTNLLNIYSYISKYQDFGKIPQITLELTKQLRNKRRLTYSGIFRTFRRKSET